jgi:hypothetical protein
MKGGKGGCFHAPDFHSMVVTMTPQNQNILSTLNLLFMLFRANKQRRPKLSDEQLHTLNVTKAHLVQGNITLPVFVNTLETLSQKGYLLSVAIVTKEHEEAIRTIEDDEKFNEIVNKVQNSDKNVLSIEVKEKIAQAFETMIPYNSDFKLDREGLVHEEVSITDFMKAGRESALKLVEDGVATVILMPFRDIKVLLDKMNDGKGFNEIQDSSIWYDSHGFKFHLKGKVIHTAYQGKANVEHDVLKKINENIQEGVIWYDDVTEHKPDSIRRRLRDFVDKDKELKTIFNVYSDRLVFDKEAFR